MVVANVVGEKSFQVKLIKSDDMISQVAPTTLDPSLRDAVLPRTPERGSNRPDIQRSNGCGNLDSVLAVTVKDKKPGS